MVPTRQDGSWDIACLFSWNRNTSIPLMCKAWWMQSMREKERDVHRPSGKNQMILPKQNDVMYHVGRFFSTITKKNFLDKGSFKWFCVWRETKDGLINHLLPVAGDCPKEWCRNRSSTSTWVSILALLGSLAWKSLFFWRICYNTSWFQRIVLQDISVNIPLMSEVFKCLKNCGC